jgi:RNA polymerase sigma-70 factor (ECF subfamily)
VEHAHERPRPADVDEALAQAGWVQRLARKLALDDDAAEDVVQKTWLAALIHLPAESGRRRPWLARVVRNFASEDRRERAHRDARESQSARSEREPSASDTAERLETQRALLDALESLEEPLRTTVLQRYFDGLSAADIARDAGIPAATVRWRLMRGIDELRVKLDKRYGDRATWCLAFAPLVRVDHVLPLSVASGASVTGVLVMNAVARTSIVAAVVLSASLGVWLATRDVDPLASPAEPRAAESIALGAPDATPRSTTELASAESSEARAALKSEPAREAHAIAPPAPDSAHIEGRFVDVSGHPLANVRVKNPLALDDHPVASDALGRFAFDIQSFEGGGSRLFVAECAGFATHFGRISVPEKGSVRVGDVVLEVGGAIAGIVTDRDGAPIAGARVLATRPELSESADFLERLGPDTHLGAPEALSGSDGSFRVEGVPAKLVRAWAGIDGMRWAWSAPVEVAPHAVTSGVVLKLEPLAADDRIEGVVLDPDGRPMPRIQVGYEYHAADQAGSAAVMTNDRGRFEILLIRKVPHGLEVSDPDSRWPTVMQSGVKPGTLDVVLRFREPQHVALYVRDERGDPVSSFEVEMLGADNPARLWREPEKTHADGRVDVSVPTVRFTLDVWAHGRSRERLGPFEPDQVAPRLDCTLVKLPGLRGRVLAGDAPVEGAKIAFYPLLERGDRMEKNGYLVRFVPSPIATCTSDTEGRFEITLRSRGSFAVLCEKTGRTLAEVALDDFDPKAGRENFEIRMLAGGTLEGRVLVPDGRDASGIVVGITRFDGKPRAQRTESDGSFRFEGLTPGGWSVKRVSAELDPSTSTTSSSRGGPEVKYETDCVIEDGRVTRFELDLRDTFEAVLVGRVSVNGEPATGWTVMLSRADQSSSVGPQPGGAVDASGSLRVKVVKPGKYDVALRPPVGSSDGLVFAQRVELQPGENPWIVDLECGALEGIAPVIAEGATLRFHWLDAGELSCDGRLRIDGAGRFNASVVPAGRAMLEIWSGADASKRVSEHDVSVKRGETATIDLR